MSRLALRKGKQLKLLLDEGAKSVIVKEKKAELVRAMAELLLVTARALKEAEEDDVGIVEKDDC